jgi:hypothetical protein
MNRDAAAHERWPPIYDAQQLAEQIKDLSSRGELNKQFYSNEVLDVPWCQGDVIELSSQFPYIDHDGEPSVLESPSCGYWLLMSNTCDLTRNLADVRWANLVPLFEVQPSKEELDVLQQYSQSRKFYAPPWAPEIQHMVAELTMPITVDRRCLDGRAVRVASMSRIAWYLFHSCIVRYLARDDGRLD